MQGVMDGFTYTAAVEVSVLSLCVLQLTYSASMCSYSQGVY